MKTKRFLQGFATFAIIVLFAGCTNILDSKTAEKSKENTSVSINFNANGRYISAGSFELNRITSWKVIFKSDSGEKDIELAWSSETSDSSSNSSSPSLNYSEGVLNAKLIPTGIYDITLEGSYSEGNGTVTVSGTKEDVTVSSETAKNNITVIVGLKKDSSVNGSLELYFNTTGIPDYASALLVTLKNIQTGNIEYSTDSTDEKTLVFSASDNGYTLTGENIAPGWYKLEFYHSDSVKIEIPGDKMMVEIASGIKTTDSDIKLSGTSVKRYYATNDNSESDQKMNGLSVSSRKNLTALLETLTESWPGVPKVEIFMDKVPEIDIKTFNELKKTLGNSKNLSIYLGESTSPIITANSSDTNAVNTDLSGSAWLVATDGNENFEITNLSVGQEQANSIDITLKNGACLDVTGEMSFSGNLNIYAIKDSEDGTVQDNFASYIATPFFSSFYNTDVDSFSLREYASKEVSEHNTIIRVSGEAGGDSCEFYIKPASMEGITAESSDNLSIEAYYSSGSDKNVYVSGSAIPYESSYLEIKLNYPKGIEIKKCLWYLNGESFDDSVSELTGFVPTQASSLKVDGTNVISCFASVGEKLYLCEFNFTFKTPSRSAAVWFSGEGNNYSMKQIYDYTDSTATEIIKENLTSKYYCFDKNYNLWTAISGDDALTLNKYSMKVSTGSYSTDPDLTKQLSEITSLSDMCYDCVNSYIYLLVSGDASVGVYAVSTGSEPAIVASAKIDISALENAGTFTNIAVNGNDFYFADSSCNVYKATGTVTSDTIEIETPTFVRNLASSDILEGYDSSKHDDTYDSISITDLQFGDGLGYGAEHVYALIKESSWGLGFTHSDYFYSRGALVKINATDGSFIDKFGWTFEQTTLSYTYYDIPYTDYYYIPDATDLATTAFFGPEKFCAVVPKKIVVVDDGFYWKAGDNGGGTIKNKDSIVEFDIAGSTLTRGSASISASFNIGATDYYSGKVEN